MDVGACDVVLVPTVCHLWRSHAKVEPSLLALLVHRQGRPRQMGQNRDLTLSWDVASLPNGASIFSQWRSWCEAVGWC
ncbi:hypothetical protein QQF64_008330 [Cirrhinus molitorella]|uniref:Uncharacterized protein n=1 Tax=Cirrhinus molitorella TaxID=172907 RepID=A0ABR3M5U6_9TELE